MRNTRVVLVLGLLAVVALVGCKSQPVMSDEPLTGTYEEPLWVTKGVSVFEEEVGKAFYGVGIASGKAIPDPYLKSKAATERGKVEVAGQLRTFVTAVFKDFTEAAMSPSMDEGTMRSITSNTIKSVIDETLMGAEVRDQWESPKGVRYVLVRVGMDSVAKQLKDQVAKIEQERLRLDAAAAQKELDEIIEKRRQMNPQGF